MKSIFIRLLTYLLNMVMCLLAIPTAVVILSAVAAIAAILFVAGLVVLPMCVLLMLRDWLNEKLFVYGEYDD
jgi:hypothetical protein